MFGKKCLKNLVAAVSLLLFQFTPLVCLISFSNEISTMSTQNNNPIRILRWYLMFLTTCLLFLTGLSMLFQLLIILSTRIVSSILGTTRSIFKCFRNTIVVACCLVPTSFMVAAVFGFVDPARSETYHAICIVFVGFLGGFLTSILLSYPHFWSCEKIIKLSKTPLLDNSEILESII
jgi:hypothetical protein